MNFFRQFHETGRFVRSLNATVERERKKKNLNSHSCNVYLQLRDIYIQG